MKTIIDVKTKEELKAALRLPNCSVNVIGDINMNGNVVLYNTTTSISVYAPNSLSSAIFIPLPNEQSTIKEIGTSITNIKKYDVDKLDDYINYLIDMFEYGTIGKVLRKIIHVNKL